jgi:N-acetylglutamate synthase-like GNAT family acetyltransferase
VTLRKATVADTDAALAMVGRCSRATLFHRFHSFTDGVAYTRSLLRDHPHDETLIAWNRSICVGLATLAYDEDEIPELAVLVEDTWQRRRIGSRLVRSLLERARATGVAAVHAHILGDDRFIVDVLRQVGHLAVSVEQGAFSVTVDLTAVGTSGLVRPR